MEKIQFANGVKEFSVNGRGILRFHPGDPNVYARFFEAAEKIEKLVQQLGEQSEGQADSMTGRDAIALMEQADRQTKQVLSWTFGPENDFDKILEGVNLLSVAENGKQVITNLLEALEPILLEGARQCAKEQADAAVKNARLRRENHE